LKAKLETTRHNSFVQQRREETSLNLEAKTPLRLRDNVKNVISIEVGLA